jgi:hypothetical protein
LRYLVAYKSPSDVLERGSPILVNLSICTMSTNKCQNSQFLIVGPITSVRLSIRLSIDIQDLASKFSAEYAPFP